MAEKDVRIVLKFFFLFFLSPFRRDFDDDSWECRLAFDPNTKDVTGQTSLYVSCLLGNTALISMLLSWKVRYVKVSTIGTVSSERKNCENSQEAKST